MTAFREKTAYTDAFDTVNPIAAFVFFAFALAVPMLLLHPPMLAVSFLAALSWHLLIRGKRALGFLLKFVLPVMLLTAIINPLFNHAGLTTLFYLKNNPITLEAILYGLSSALMLGTVVTWFACFNRIFTSDKLIYLTGRLAPSLSLVISMALRFVPLFTKQAKRIALANRASGMAVSDGKIRDRVKNALAVFSGLVTWALENSVTTADSMRARGYGLHPRSSFALFRFDRRDLVISLLLALGIAATGLAAGFGVISVRFYPSFKMNALSAPFIVFLLVYTLTLFIPFLLNLYEAHRWRLLRSKI